MMNTFLRQSLQLTQAGIVSLCLLLVTPLLQAAEDEAVARVISASGDVTAMAGEDIRILARGDEVFVGDIVTTGPNGFAQLRFIDSAIVALKADTAFEISEYVFEQNADDRATMNLIQGGFRTITGRIGKADRDAYRVVTPYATIGIRGTDYEQVITPTGLMSGVFDGGISLQNDAGLLNLGVGAQFDYAMVTGNSTAPLGLTEQPPELGNTLMVEEEESQGAENENESEEEGGALPVAPVENTVALRDQGIGGQENDDEASINPNESGDGSLSCRNGAAVCQDDDGPGPGPDPDPDPEPEPEPEPGGDPLAALSDAEEASLDNDAVGRIVYGSTRSRFSGQAGVDDREGNAGQNTTLLANDRYVLRYSGRTDNAQQNVGGYDIEWGIWRSNNRQPLVEQDREDGSSIHEFEDTVLLFAAADKVTPTFTGRKTFAATDDFLAIAGERGASVSDVDGELDINLATADVQGGMTVTVNSSQGVNYWNAVVDGTLRHRDGVISGMQVRQNESFIESAESDSQSGPRNFKGDINGIFTGKGGTGLLLDFDFSELRDSRNYVIGYSLFEQVEDKEIALDWGSWDRPVLENWHEDMAEPASAHLEGKTKPSDMMLWILNNMGGAYAYESAGGFGRGFGGSSGELSDVQANFNIDFDTGDISNGQLLVTDANLQNWAVAFDGALTGGDVSLAALPGTFTIDNVTNGGDVALGGAFTDFLASGFTGAFEMIDGNDAGNFVQGMFDLTRGPQVN